MTHLLPPGPLMGQPLLDLWPRLKPHVQAAILGQDAEVCRLMVDILAGDASQLAVIVTDTADIVVFIAGRPFCGVPLAVLADDGQTAH